jgi:hypothetical protein
MYTISSGHVQVRHTFWVLLASAFLLWGGRGTALAQHLDAAEVTNRDYHAFILATGREAPAHWDGMTFPPGTAEEPVTLVTWYDAREYCAWHGKRLPSQEEWQQACQAPAFRKHGDVWEWTQSGEAEWKVLCGPQGTCACSHRYRPTWKNAVKGFRCATDQPLAGWQGRGSRTAQGDTPIVGSAGCHHPWCQESPRCCRDAWRSVPLPRVSEGDARVRRVGRAPARVGYRPGKETSG